jgi:hypothetical protein
LPFFVATYVLDLRPPCVDLYARARRVNVAKQARAGQDDLPARPKAVQSHILTHHKKRRGANARAENENTPAFAARTGATGIPGKAAGCATEAHVRSTRRLHDALDGVRLDDDAVLAELLLHEDDLLRALDDEVPAGVERALVHARERGLRAAREHALVAPEHERQPADVDVLALDDLLAARVLDRDEDRRGVRRVAQAALVRRDGLVDRVRVRAVGEADADVGVLEPEARVDVRGHLVVRAEDVLDVDVDKVVERVDVLLHEPLDLEERRQKQPFVLWETRLGGKPEMEIRADTPRRF